MKKQIAIFGTLMLLASSLMAQSDEELFGSADDDFFADDGIVELEAVSENVESASEDLKKGVLYEDGSIKIGGSLLTTLGTNTTVYDNSEKKFRDNLADTTLTPTVNAMLSVDARPNQNLRIYSKFGFNYPADILVYKSGETDISYLISDYTSLIKLVINPGQPETYTVKEWFQLKELFTDFSIADTVFFRFGLHTVSWGAGYFYSPVSDMINTSSIDPENVDVQVDGSLNLRTQIVFPNTQNCLWFYLIPDNNFVSGFLSNSTTTYAKNTALAGKADVVLGNWELGLGGLWKYENAPKAMATATGSLGKLGIFGEAVYSYGGESEWAADKTYKDKSHIFQGTLGGMYTWKKPMITLGGQYYYDGNKCDDLAKIEYKASSTNRFFPFESSGSIAIPRITQGHNIAFLTNFGKLFGRKDINIALFGMFNFGRDGIRLDMDDSLKSMIEENEDSIIEALQLDKILSSATLSAMLNYSPVSSIKMAVGPYVMIKDFSSAPDVAVRFTFTLGGGKF